MNDFPSSPTVGQIVTFASGASYRWNGAQWDQLTNPTSDPYLFPTADMRLKSKSSGLVAFNSKADNSGTDVLTIDNGGQISCATLVAAGNITGQQNFAASTANVVLACAPGAGNVILRPNGAGSVLNQVTLDSSGLFSIDATNGVTRGGKGYTCRAGYANGYVGNVFNLNYNAGPVQLWIDTSNMGNITVTSDYRIKKDVAPLGSMWETVRGMRPVSYTQAEFTPPTEMDNRSAEVTAPMFPADDIERWGFVAHEIQEDLLPTAANGVKDSYDEVQSLNLAPVVAALTKALQEAMARIEALEARA